MRIIILLALASMTALAQRTTVTGTVVLPNGVFASNCTVYVRANSTWVNNADATVTMLGTRSTATTNASGVFSIQIYPNDATTPSSTSYQATYTCTTQKQTWSVPTSGSPVTVQSVTVAATPPAVTPFVQSIFGQSNIITTLTAGNGHTLTYTGTGIINANRILGTTLTSLTGVVKMTAGVPSVVAGVASDCVKVDGSSGACGGGGGSPGGSSGQLQYNNAGAFGGLGFGNGVQNSGGNVQVDTSVVATLNAPNTFANSVDVTGATFSRKLSIDTVGADIASATTIAPDSPIHKVTGTTTTTTITVPASCAATGKGCTITFIPAAAWPLNTGGNIGKAVTATANVPIVLTYSHALAAWYPLTDTGGSTTPTTLVVLPGTCRADGTCDSLWGSSTTSGSNVEGLNNSTQNIPAMRFVAGAPSDSYAYVPFTVPNNYTSGNISVRVNYVTVFGGSDVWKFSSMCPTGDEALARSFTAEQTVNETSTSATTTYWGGDFSLAALTLDSTCTAGVSGYIKLRRNDSATGHRWVLSVLITFP